MLGGESEMNCGTTVDGSTKLTGNRDCGSAKIEAQQATKEDEVSFDPWIVFEAGKVAVTEGALDEAVEHFSSVLQYLYGVAL